MANKENDAEFKKVIASGLTIVTIVLVLLLHWALKQYRY